MEIRHADLQIEVEEAQDSNWLMSWTLNRQQQPWN